MDTDARQTGIAAISALPTVTQNSISIEWCASLFKKWTLFVIRYGLTSQETCIFNSPLHGQGFSHTARIKLLVFFKPLCFLCLSRHCTCYCFWNSVMIKVSPVRRCQPHPFLLFSSSRSPASFVSTKRKTQHRHTCDELCTLFLSVLCSEQIAKLLHSASSNLWYKDVFIFLENWTLQTGCDAIHPVVQMSFSVNDSDARRENFTFPSHFGGHWKINTVI